MPSLSETQQKELAELFGMTGAKAEIKPSRKGFSVELWKAGDRRRASFSYADQCIFFHDLGMRGVHRRDLVRIETGEFERHIINFMARDAEGPPVALSAAEVAEERIKLLSQAKKVAEFLRGNFDDKILNRFVQDIEKVEHPEKPQMSQKPALSLVGRLFSVFGS